MIDEIEKFNELLKKVKNNKEVSELTKKTDALDIAISNADLLSDNLLTFCKKENFRYFPKCVSEQIHNFIRDANAQLNSLLNKDTSQNTELYKNLDQLYALCLQHGIITFGFNEKELIKILDDTKRSTQNITEKIKGLNTEIQNKIDEAKTWVDKQKTEFNKQLEAEKIKYTEKKENTVDEINKAFDVFSSIYEESKKQIGEKIQESQKLLGQIKQIQKDTKSVEQDTVEIQKNTNYEFEETKKIKQESLNIKGQIDSENKNAQTIISQMQPKLDNANQMASQIEAKNNTADANLAQILEKKKAAEEFYASVENYKNDMLATSKKSQADYGKLKDECDTKLAEYSSETQKIIDDNNEYQVQIKDLLSKAVSGGLFKVFNQRQVLLSKGTNFWKWAVVAATLLVVIGIFVVAWICDAKPDIIFFVRLGVMIPLAFLMFFAATQYKKERQAEEEYAFKSAISLSLEPYRDLLVRMRKDDQLEADFVKKLMEEVFDNPVMRMFNVEEEEEKICKIIVGYLKKLPSDKSCSIIETVTKQIAEK